VFVFFAGAGAAKFVKDYQAAGLKGKIPLYGRASSPTARSRPWAAPARAC
jgi:hypothetical protein